MPKGIVKFYNQKSKFGFIIVDDSKSEIYTKGSLLIDEIKDGDLVSFKIKPHKKGEIASDVKLIANGVK